MLSTHADWRFNHVREKITGLSYVEPRLSRCPPYHLIDRSVPCVSALVTMDTICFPAC